MDELVRTIAEALAERWTRPTEENPEWRRQYRKDPDTTEPEFLDVSMEERIERSCLTVERAGDGDLSIRPLTFVEVAEVAAEAVHVLIERLEDEAIYEEVSRRVADDDGRRLTVDELLVSLGATSEEVDKRLERYDTEVPTEAASREDLGQIRGEQVIELLEDKDAEIERLRAALGRARSGLVVAETTLGWVAARCYDSIFADENYRDLLTAEDVARTSVYRIDDALADQGGTCCD